MFRERFSRGGSAPLLEALQASFSRPLHQLEHGAAFCAEDLDPRPGEACPRLGSELPRDEHPGSLPGEPSCSFCSAGIAPGHPRWPP